jgi:hypothetical protein
MSFNISSTQNVSRAASAQRVPTDGARDPRAGAQAGWKLPLPAGQRANARRPVHPPLGGLAAQGGQPPARPFANVGQQHVNAGRHVHGHRRGQHLAGAARRHPAPMHPNDPRRMTTLLGLPESVGAVNALAKEIHGVNDRIKFGAKSMASFGIYPLVKLVQAHMAGVPLRAFARAFLFN